MQYSETLRNNQVAQIEATVGASARLHLFSGAPPANTLAADSGIKLIDMTLPVDWMNAAAAGAVTKLGTWSGTGIAANSAGYFRIKDSTGTTTHVQGTVTITGGGGDMTVDNTSIQVAQVATVTGFSITAGNA